MPVRNAPAEPGAQGWFSVSENSTWAQYKRLVAKEAATKALDKTPNDEGLLLEIPRDKYPELDRFEDILEAGSRVAARSRSLLITLPMVAMAVSFGMCVLLGWEITRAVSGGLPAVEIITKYRLFIQLDMFG